MLIDIGGWIYGLFGPYGAGGIMLCIFLIFLIDAVLFPTLPELFFVIAFMYSPTVPFGIALLLSASIAEIIGLTTLYLVVEHVSVPDKIKSAADKYANFLIVSDEKALLMNRVAPIIPFAGAFVSLISSWRLDRALMYVVIGCWLKYGAIMLMSSAFYTYLNSDMAQTVTLIFIFAIIIISIAASFLKKKKEGLINENS